MDGNAMGVLQEKGITRWVVEAGWRAQEREPTQAQRRESTSSQEMSEVIVV